MKNDEAEAVIIGGMVLDIHAIPSIPANPRTTTPGKVLLFYLFNYFCYVITFFLNLFIQISINVFNCGELIISNWSMLGMNLNCFAH